MEFTRLEEAPRMEDFFLGRERLLSCVVVVGVAGSLSRAARIVGAVPPLLSLVAALVGDWCCW